MGRPKRNAHAAAVESTTPPDELTANQFLACVIKAEGNSVYSCSLPDKRTVMVQLADRFRNTIWVKRGGYVLVDLTPSQEMKGKAEGEIVNVVRDEKSWRKQSYWLTSRRPKEFAPVVYSDEEESDSNVGKMPPSDSEDED